MRAKLSKRGAGIAFSQLVLAILALATVGTVVYIAASFNESPVRSLLGLGNITKFDQELVERYEVTKAMNADAINSVYGLLFALNRLAVYNTYTTTSTDLFATKSKESKQLDNILTDENYIKTFPHGASQNDGNAVTAAPTFYDNELVELREQTANDDSQNFRVVEKTLECLDQFWDKANTNVRCSMLKENKSGSVSALKSEDELIKSLVKYAQTNPGCKANCKDRISKLIGYDVEGCSWYNLFCHTANIFNVQNIDWGVEAGNTESIYVCGNYRGVNEIHFKTLDENYCDAPVEDQALGYKVVGFNLPQEITKQDILPTTAGKLDIALTPVRALIYGVDEWLNAYGDPEYILFYEKFPDGEDEYWKASSYNVAFLTILEGELGGEVLFLGIDGITFGLGRILRPLLSPVKTIIVSGVKASNKAVGAVIRQVIQIASGSEVKEGFIKEGIKKVGKKMSFALLKPFSLMNEQILMRVLKQELTEETIENAAKASLRGKLKKALGSQYSDEILEKIAKRYKDAFREFREEVGDDAYEAFYKNGRLTSEGKEALEQHFQTSLKQAGGELDDDTLRLLKKNIQNFDEFAGDLGKKLTEGVATAEFRAIPRVAITTYRTVARAKNLIMVPLTGDLTEEAREKAIKEIIKNGEESIRTMKPRDLAKFIRHQEKAVNQLIDKKTGKLLIEGLKDQDAAKLDEILLRNAPDYVNFNEQIVRLVGRVSDKTLEKHKLRHTFIILTAVYATKIESMAAKHYPVGTNALGLKTPFEAPVSFDEVNVGQIKGIGNRARYEELAKTNPTKLQETLNTEFFPYVGTDERYNGLLPEVRSYYLSLTKDQENWWKDQEPQRFYLVSPCMADLYLRVSRCRCGFHPDDKADVKKGEGAGIYESGEEYEKLDGTVFRHDFKFPENDDTITITNDDQKVQISAEESIKLPNDDKMLYKLDSKDRPIKECHDFGWFQLDNEYTPLCIKINPVQDNYKVQGEYNYCYHGVNPAVQLAKAAITAAQIGVAIGAGFLCGPPCAIAIGFISSLGGETAKAGIDTQHQWPNHD